MSAASNSLAPDHTTLKRIETGLRMVTVPLPHLAGLAAAVRVNLDLRVPTMGIFASGRLIANPGFVARLKDNELVFVLAHELLHLALQTHARARGSSHIEFNYAHDYIINDILRAELGFASIPAGGLDMPGARAKSAEQIVLEMRRNADLMQSRTQVWEGREVSARRIFAAGAGRPAGGSGADEPDGGDVLSDTQERKLFPAESGDLEQRKVAMQELAARGLLLAKVLASVTGRGAETGASTRMMSAVRGHYRSSWQRALQKWIESSAPGERTFARPSRRNPERSDIVLAGRKRESWMLNIILDTSGSMTEFIPYALGAIGDFCDTAGVDQIRIVQCDVAVTSDETVSPDALATFPVSGFGGSDLSPAMLSLADDPLVTATLVVTDGEIAFPPDPMPYSVVWVLPAGNASHFNPPYGHVIAIDGSRT